MSSTTGPQTHPSIYSPLKIIFIGFLIVLGMYVLSTVYYLVYHTIIESLRIVVIFLYSYVIWKRRHDLDNDYMIILGLILPMVAILIFLHTLSFKGMNFFRDFNADLPTQLWIAERYIVSLTFLIAPFFLKRQRQTGKNINPYAVLGAAGASVALVLISLFYWHNFPSCYTEGRGLTIFKIFSEYLFIITIFISIALLESQRQRFDPIVLRWLILFLFFNAMADLAFTTYINVYGLANFLGHIALSAAFYCLFRVARMLNGNRSSSKSSQ